MITGRVVGGQEIARAFRELEKKIRNRALREAVKAGTEPLVAALKAAVAAQASDTRALERSIGAKRTSYKGGRVAMGIVGARLGFARQITRTSSKRGKVKIKGKRLKKGERGQGEVRDPAKYLHLADRGRKAVRAKKKAFPIPVGGGIAFSRRARAARGAGFMEATARKMGATIRAAMVGTLRTETEAAIMQSAAP